MRFVVVVGGFKFVNNGLYGDKKVVVVGGVDKIENWFKCLFIFLCKIK